MLAANERTINSSEEPKYTERWSTDKSSREWKEFTILSGIPPPLFLFSF